MTPEQFTYWLQGFVEISQKPPTDKEWLVIKDHLATVFNKVTPDRTTIRPAIAEPYRGYPVTPAPIGPYMPTNPLAPWTSPTPWPYNKPVVTCSTVNAAGGMGFSAIKVRDLT